MSKRKRKSNSKSCQASITVMIGVDTWLIMKEGVRESWILKKDRCISSDDVDRRIRGEMAGM